MNYHIEINNNQFPVFYNSKCVLPFENKKTLAIVASSGTLLDTEYGDEIDKHDVVVRFNAARIKGFEKNVGTKTDVRILNGHAFNNSTGNDICFGDNNFIPTLENECFIIKSFSSQEFIEGTIMHSNKNYLNFLHPSFLGYCNSLVSSPEASCGLMGIMLALTLGYKPTLYGYGFYKESNDRVHYWEEVNPNWKSEGTSHKFKEEEELIKNFEHFNQLIIK